MKRVLICLGDLFERGVPNEWPTGRWQAVCFNVSQTLYELAWRRDEEREARPKRS